MRTMTHHHVFVVFSRVGAPGGSRDWAQTGENCSIGGAGVPEVAEAGPICSAGLSEL